MFFFFKNLDLCYNIHLDFSGFVFVLEGVCGGVGGGGNIIKLIW